MVTYWESSRKPLYVRTIWKDGQHHVILDGTNENIPRSATVRSLSKQCASNQASHRSTKSANAALNLKVSSVRVLLSGLTRRTNRNPVIGRKAREKSVERAKIWSQPSIDRPISCKNLNEEITFEGIRTYSEKDTDETYKPEKYHANMLDNALSERVLLWLDLSTEKDPKGDDALKDAFCISSNKESASEYEADFSIPKHSSSRLLRGKNESIVVHNNEEKSEPPDNFYQSISPTERDKIGNNHKSGMDGTISKGTAVRRQLHIFIPSLPKKRTECDNSIFSGSKLSVN